MLNAMELHHRLREEGLDQYAGRTFFFKSVPEFLAKALYITIIPNSVDSNYYISRKGQKFLKELQAATTTAEKAAA